MSNLVAQQRDASCNHTVNDAVAWMVVAQSGTLRANIPLEQVIDEPKTLLLKNGDNDITFHVCRRDCCNSGGTCLDDTFKLPSLSKMTIDASSNHQSLPPMTCQTPSDVSRSLQNGAWNRNGNGKETWKSATCAMPKTVAPPGHQKQRVLFIGDSTLQELALLTAQAARSTSNPLGIRNDIHLNCTCTQAYFPGTTKDCRMFDATGPLLNTSMLWAGHTNCEDNRMGVSVVDDEDWRQMVTNKVETIQPNIVFFQVPISHSCTDIRSCIPALERYICFVTQLPPQAVLMITGAALTRYQCQGPTGRHCPLHLRKWIQTIKEIMAQLAPQVPILDIFHPTEQWVNLTSPKDPFVPACRGQQRHLTCDFTNLDFDKAIDSPFYILPPGRLAGEAMMQMMAIAPDNEDTSEANRVDNVPSSKAGRTCQTIGSSTYSLS